MNLGDLTTRKHVDPNGALMESLEELAVLIVTSAGGENGKHIPWRLGPTGEVGLPLAAVSRAVRTTDDALNVDAGAMFVGRQSLHERLTCGFTPDEQAISIWELPTVLSGPVTADTPSTIAPIRVAANNARNLLARLMDMPATA